MEKSKEVRDYNVEMTNEEYRDALRNIFDNIHENYKLRWFYRFIVAKIEGSS